MTEANKINNFDSAMFDVYKRAKDEAGYTATIFAKMLSERGGLDTAKYLINSSAVSSGYTALWERQRLDLTVEALVIENPEWHSLFTDHELQSARKRLAAYHYTFGD